MHKSNQFCGSISFILKLEIIQLRGALIQNELILFMPKLPFDPPKNIETFGFLLFSGKTKENIEKERPNHD